MPHHSYVVTSAADTTAHGTLRSAILFANAHPGTTITFAHKLAHHTITLSHELPLILGNGTVIDGSGAPHLTINGHDQFRAFFVGDTTHTISATIENLAISHAAATGGNGGGATGPGGGGAGLGGAIFVSDHASLAISGLTLSGNAATGGNGGGFIGNTAGAGGGMGGNGGSGTVGPGGGGGFGTGADGGDGSASGTNGKPGQFTNGAAGGNANGGSGIGGANGGGGAGGNASANGGGGGGVGGGNASGLTAGAGGFGGGGGGGIHGGNGGFGGGGGAGPNSAGVGGYGGGGAASFVTGSLGGFGGGSGSAVSGIGGGGGGAGMGGAIFVMDGGRLTARGNVTVTGNTVAGGVATGIGTSGSSFGAGLFLNGNGTLHFTPGAGQTERIINAIDDEAGVVANGYMPPGTFTLGHYNLIKSGMGTLTLSADNAYSGVTTVSAGTLVVNGSIRHSATTVKSGATLSGHGTTGDVTVLAGGTLSAGAGAAILDTGNLLLRAHAHFAVQLGGANPGPHGFDQIDVTGTVQLAGATLDLSLIGAFHGHKGETFEIISNDGTDPVVGHFAGLAEGDHVTAGGKVFSISYHGGDGNDVVLTEHGNGVAHAAHLDSPHNDLLFT